MVEQDGTAVRVLLLARAGEARQRLEQALAQAGAELVQAIDPGEGDPDAALALRPAAVLVALEPVIEEALERFDRLLSDPAVLVMFDEAEVAARRDGWDAARWVRHLAAKLHGHQDVLPPGAESADAVHPAPGALPDREFDPEGIDVAAFSGTAFDLAQDVPRAASFEQPVGVPDAPTQAEPGTAAGLPEDAPGDPAEAAGFSGLVSAEDMDWSASAEAYGGASLDEDPALAELLASSAAARAAATPADDVAKDMDSAVQVAADASDVSAGIPHVADAAVDAQVPEVPGAAIEWSLSDLDGPAPAPVAAAAEQPAIDPLSLGEGLSLAEDDGPISVRDTSGVIDLEALESRLSGLSLVDPESYGQGSPRGAVLVEAGIGGPDPVRQLLGGLQSGFPRPVLIRLQLDGGRYERLVQQMQRASTLPVELAAEGAGVEAGTVYFLQPGTTLVADRADLRFATDVGTDGGYGALPAGDSAFVFLSGADPSRVDAAMARAGEGALVIAQSPDTCYDGSAAVALVARGAVIAEPGDLAQALLDFWH